MLLSDEAHLGLQLPQVGRKNMGIFTSMLQKFRKLQIRGVQGEAV